MVFFCVSGSPVIYIHLSLKLLSFNICIIFISTSLMPYISVAPYIHPLLWHSGPGTALLCLNIAFISCIFACNWFLSHSRFVILFNFIMTSSIVSLVGRLRLTQSGRRCACLACSELGRIRAKQIPAAACAAQLGLPVCKHRVSSQKSLCRMQIPNHEWIRKN